MTQILLPTDMSEGSRKAVFFALDAFGTEQCRYTFLHSIGDVPRPTMIPEYLQYVETEAREELDKLMAEVRALHPGKTLDLVGLIERGSVYAVIDSYIRENPVDMVVMGTRGEGRSHIWGSNAEVVSRNAEGPVIVVPPDWEAGPITKILYADDREEVTDLKTLHPLVQLAERYAAEIDFMHVSPNEGAHGPVPGSASNAELFKGIKTNTVSTTGNNVTKSLTDLADSGQYGMLAVLHRKMGLLDALIHRSVAKRMAWNTTVPLLVMHE